jgi:dihydroxyacid dehydratase/phosphogluconate dehydratase
LVEPDVAVLVTFFQLRCTQQLVLHAASKLTCTTACSSCYIITLQVEAGMVGYRFNTIGVSDGISMGTDGMSFSLQSRCGSYRTSVTLENVW